MGMMEVFKKLLGQSNEAEVRRLQKIADQVLAKEAEYRALTDEQLQAKTPEFKKRLQAGETLDDLLPDAFAACREAAERTVGMRPYPVQVIGGVCLHQGRIAEMKTGEGKTLVATLPAYLNALTGEGVHIVTVNDYLARRDSEWMGKIYKFMGLTVGLIVHDLDNAQRRAAYACDITYGTNNEMGFDYLRDNMVIHERDMVQRGHVYAIVDEVDSILIDEARTPLIISGQGDKSTDLYEKANQFVSRLKNEEDYTIAEKEKQAQPTAAPVLFLSFIIPSFPKWPSRTNGPTADALLWLRRHRSSRWTRQLPVLRRYEPYQAYTYTILTDRYRRRLYKEVPY